MQFKIVVRRIGNNVSTEVTLHMSPCASYVSIYDEIMTRDSRIFEIDHRGSIEIKDMELFNNLVDDLKLECLRHLQKNIKTSLRLER